MNHHYFLPVELLFADLDNYFPKSKLTVSDLAKSHFYDELTHYKSGIILKYINPLTISLSVATDAEGAEKTRITCAVIHKTRYLFNVLQKNKRFNSSHCPMLPIQYFISKKV